MTQLQTLPVVLSHTSLNDYRTCPKRFFHKHIAKDAKEVKSFQQNTGISVHDALRKRIKLREPLPEEFKDYETVCAEVESIPGVKYVELKLGVSKSGHACDFFADEVHFRGALDLAISDAGKVFILDWKTGKPWEDPLELCLQAMLLRARYPDMTAIVGAFYWLREKRMGPVHPRVDDTATTWNDLCQWSDQILCRVKGGDWPADDGPLCGFCPVSKQQCAHKRDPK